MRGSLGHVPLRDGGECRVRYGCSGQVWRIRQDNIGLMRNFAYLGLNEDGTLSLFVSTQKLNIIGTRLEKGSKMPLSVYNFTENPCDDNAILALRGVQDYVDGKGQRSGLVFGEEIRKKRRK